LDAKNADAYIGLGDLYDRQNVDELALSNYEKAIELRPDYVKGWLRVGQIKKKMKDYKGAAEGFQKAIELAPDFPPAYKEMAEMWILAGEFEKALEKIKKYLEMVNNDTYAKSRYAVVLYMSKQYEQSLKETEEVLKDTTMITMLRLAFYNAVELKKIDKAQSFHDQFFAKIDPKKILHTDYAYEARLLQLKGDLEGAEAKFLKALETSKEAEQYTPEYLENISDLYRDAKNYKKQAEYLDKYLNAEGVVAKLSSLFNLGKAYYFAGNELGKADSANPDAANAIVPEEAMTMFKKADSTFAAMISQKEDLHIGWAWRGRSNAKMDPGNKEGKALPYYQKVLEIIGDNADAIAKFKQDYIEAHRYIGAYYTLVKEDCETALIHWNKIKEVDPENKQATDAIAFCNQ
jgi:tetratricopeptide (TPR) repeat protein